MKRVKDFINKYYKWIILVLLSLLLMKSCNSCSTQRQYEYKINKYELKIDSLESTIKDNLLIYKTNNDSLRNELLIIKSQNDILNSTIETTRRDIDHYRDINNNLINTNNNLVNVTENLSQHNEIEDNN